MAIKYKIPIDIIPIESRYSLSLERKRMDVCNVLKKLDEGTRLETIFPIQSVYQSILKQFVDRGYIDNSQVVQNKGHDFIENPYYDEEETGIYNIEFTQLNLAGTNYQIILKMNRTLANEDSTPTKFNFDNLICDNELKMGDDEIITVKSIVNKSRNSAYLCSRKHGNFEIDLSTAKYNAGNGYMKLGDVLSEKMINSLKNIFISNITYMTPTDNFDSLIIKNIKDIDFESLCNGRITREVTGFEIVNHPIKIDELQIANQYAYLFMYNKIIDGEYLKYEEMNEIFANEVLSSSIYTDDIKEQMTSFTYSEAGFEKYLPKDKYDDMSYKLRVMDMLLNYSIVDNSIKNVRNYNELVNYISSIVSPSNVKKLYFVLGYAFADIKKNQIIECVEAFQQKYSDMEIIRKTDGGNQKESKSIIQSVIDHGVKSRVNREIKDYFHDRYIVFELKDGTTKTMLATNEVGQFFNLDTREPMGKIMLISNDEVVKNGKSLYKMIKEAK